MVAPVMHRSTIMALERQNVDFGVAVKKVPIVQEKIIISPVLIGECWCSQW
jgi:hypothetical protein